MQPYCLLTFVSPSIRTYFLSSLVHVLTKLIAVPLFLLLPNETTLAVPQKVSVVCFYSSTSMSDLILQHWVFTPCFSPLPQALLPAASFSSPSLCMNLHWTPSLHCPVSISLQGYFLAKFFPPIILNATIWSTAAYLFLSPSPTSSFSSTNLFRTKLMQRLLQASHYPQIPLPSPCL